MAVELDPIVGNWYLHVDKGQEFEVVAVNEAEGTVEVQHFDGDIEQFDLEEWYDLEIEPAEPPENWSGPYDDFDEDDMAPTDDEMSEEDWNRPLDDFPDAGS